MVFWNSVPKSVENGLAIQDLFALSRWACKAMSVLLSHTQRSDTPVGSSVDLDMGRINRPERFFNSCSHLL